MSDNEADYNASVVMVDPNDIELESDEDEGEDELTIDCDTGYDPMSLVSVGLEEDEEEDEEMEDGEGEAVSAAGPAAEKCDICDKVCESRSGLAKHMRATHPSSCCVACEHCGRVLADQDTYTRHLNNMHNIQLPTSPVPSKQAAAAKPKARGRGQPVLSHPGTARKCPDCEQQFATKTTLNIHRLKVHVAGLKNLPCPQCNQECSDLTSHMRRFHNVDGIVCPHCANIFSKKCTLNRHIEQVHLNIQIHKPATCPECHKVFSKKGHLDRHIKIIHQGIKDYSDPCPYCKKVFTTRASLEPHIAMVHEGVRKKCEICNKVLSDLNKHMRTVHGTYRRKAKIPKDLISEIDNPESDILPQIYGAQSAKTSPGPSPDKTKSANNIPETQQQQHNIPTPPSLPNPVTTAAPKAVSATPKTASPKRKTGPSSSSSQVQLKNNNSYAAAAARDTTAASIKQELGLSSGITLQKIVRPGPAPTKGPPKLTYHGPRLDTSGEVTPFHAQQVRHFGSIEITPLTEPSIESESSNGFVPRLVKMPEGSPSSKMIKISGKYGRKLPELVQLKDVVQNS